MKRIGCHYCCDQAVGTGRQVCANCEPLNYFTNTMNHYDTLGVASDATPDEIKRAFRKKSSQHHPDKPGGDAEKMAAVNAAYECLSDATRRLGYDQTGRDPAKGPTLDDVAEHALQTLIRQMLDDGRTGNLVHMLESHIKRGVESIKKDIALSERVVARLSKQLDRVIRKGGRASLFNRVLQEQIDRAESEIEQGRRQIEVSERSLEILREHEDTKPDDQHATQHCRPGIDELVMAFATLNRPRGFAG